jgi:hypothetical protein
MITSIVQLMCSCVGIPEENDRGFQFPELYNKSPLKVYIIRKSLCLRTVRVGQQGTVHRAHQEHGEEGDGCGILEKKNQLIQCRKTILNGMACRKQFCCKKKANWGQRLTPEGLQPLSLRGCPICTSTTALDQTALGVRSKNGIQTCSEML